MNTDCVPVIPRTNAEAPETLPMTDSPLMRSVLLALGPFKPVNVRDGIVGSALDEDSNIARTLTISGVSRDTSLSCTLLPYARLYVSPSPIEVDTPE